VKRTILLVLVIIASVIIVRSFLLPWAQVSTSATKVSEGLTDAAKGSLKDSPAAAKVIKKLEKITDFISEIGDIEIKSSISGYNIPIMVNNKTSKVALSVVALLFNNTDGLDKKSYLVYLLPLLAVICSFFAVMGVKQHWPVIAMGLISGVISVLGIYNLKTAVLSKGFVEVNIESGLWYTMYAYLAIFLISIIWILLDAMKKA